MHLFSWKINPEILFLQFRELDFSNSYYCELLGLPFWLFLCCMQCAKEHKISSPNFPVVCRVSWRRRTRKRSLRRVAWLEKVGWLVWCERWSTRCACPFGMHPSTKENEANSLFRVCERAKERGRFHAHPTLPPGSKTDGGAQKRESISAALFSLWLKEEPRSHKGLSPALIVMEIAYCVTKSKRRPALQGRKENRAREWNSSSKTLPFVHGLDVFFR